MVTNLTMSGKVIGLLKIKVFWNEGYDAITFTHGFAYKILLNNSNYIVDVAIWPTFGNFSVTEEVREDVREVIINSVL